jgi:hypothetical protein
VLGGKGIPRLPLGPPVWLPVAATSPSCGAAFSVCGALVRVAVLFLLLFFRLSAPSLLKRRVYQPRLLPAAGALRRVQRGQRAGFGHSQRPALKAVAALGRCGGLAL